MRRSALYAKLSAGDRAFVTSTSLTRTSRRTAWTSLAACKTKRNYDYDYDYDYGYDDYYYSYFYCYSCSYSYY